MVADRKVFMFSTLSAVDDAAAINLRLSKTSVLKVLLRSCDNSAPITSATDTTAIEM